ncbi:hypothetical protein [Romboutsia sp.]|uniref:hypothetical protein n=1 Tax=Romboutsia sp. TaxID=1965302 RepID=UPI002D7FFCF7|nr:hypothetical protein [Romboutsia sp.]
MKGEATFNVAGNIMTNFNKLKDLYEDGYRCIYHDCVNNNYTIYLKNFDSENSEIVELTDSNEFNQFQSYMNDLKMS